jgi:hypothetical protein
LVRPEHVKEAADFLVRSGVTSKKTGIFVKVGHRSLPAKALARVAYLISANRPLHDSVDFASGQWLVDVFENIGFEVERV